MKTRFIATLLGILMIPTISFASIPTIDLLGVPQAFMETVQTLLSKIENSAQVATLQKTMTKIGSAKSSISDFINKQKAVAEKYKEKMEVYIKNSNEYIEKTKAFNAEAKKYINSTKQGVDLAREIKEKGVDGYLKENAGSIMGKAAGSLGVEGLAASKVESLTNQAVSGDFKGMAGDMVGGVAGSVGLDASKAQGLANSAMEGDFKGMAGDMVGGVAGSVGLDASKAQGLATKAIDATAKEGNNKLVDAPTVSTTRKAGGFSTKETVTSAAEATAAKVKAATAVEAKADAQLKAKADAAVKAKVAPTAAAATVTATAAKVKAATAVEAKADAQLKAKAATAVKAKVAPTAAAAAVDVTAAKVKADAAVKAKVAPTAAKVKAIPAKQIDTKVLDPAKELNTTVTPKRTQFKSSFGYGKVQNKYQMAFASLMGEAKTGETAEGVLIVPESISLYCGLNYETALEDKNMEDCLREINTVSTSMVTEKITKKQIDDATNDLQNGYIEFLTATYFEALETYNESLTFKGNKLDPVTTTTTSDIDSSWRVAKEMHLVLGDRINRLQKLWARVLGMKMYEQFTTERFAKKSEKD